MEESSTALAPLEGAESFPELIGPEADPAVAEINYPDLALRVAYTVQQMLQAGERIAFLIANPDLATGLAEALSALPDEAYPAAFKEGLPVSVNPEVAEIQIVTQSDLERQFLERHFGPRELGGNGLLPRMQEYQNNARNPVQISVEFLRTRYLQEIADRVMPRIEVPTGSNLIRGPLR